MSLDGIDFGSIEWQDTPTKGVFVYCLRERRGSDDRVPRFTAHAVRIDPYQKISMHYHRREPMWVERLVFPNGGHFLFLTDDRVKCYVESNKMSKRVKPFEVYGITNLSNRPLYFFSIMRPGFTGFEEIVHVR